MENEISPPKQTVRDLQSAVIRSALTKDPLPGGTYRINLPDRAFFVDQEQLYVLEENLVSPIAVEKSPVPIEVIRRENIDSLAERHGGLAYLVFSRVEGTSNRLNLTLEARLAPADPSRPQMGLSGVQVTFSQVGDQWEVVEEPAAFAM